MTFDQAAKMQYRHSSIYTVMLIGPNGEREQIGTTQRKSGSSLLRVLARPTVQERVSVLPGAATATVAKKADAVIFSNGWSLVFGGTIRQEAV